MKTEINFDYHFDLLLGATVVKVDIQSHASLIGIRAPSGSGKSTFIRTIIGLKTLGRIGYVPQDSLLIPTMSVRQNLLLSPRADEKDLKEICDELSINHLLERFPRMLSGGEKQRVSIGRALLSKPEILILDEPFAALDYDIRNQIAGFIKEWINNHNAKLILVTHDLSSSDFLCEEFWTIKNNVLKISQPEQNPSGQ